MATDSSILARKIPWSEEPGGLQSMGLQESDMTEQLTVSQMTMICLGSSLWGPHRTPGFTGGGLSWLRGNGRESETWLQGW